jgi:hypothetical protein
MEAAVEGEGSHDSCLELLFVPCCCPVSQGRELLAALQDLPDGQLTYAERAVIHIAGGLLQLAAEGSTVEERAEAKQLLSKALKLAHKRLTNHEVVSQVLLLMTPLQVGRHL